MKYQALVSQRVSSKGSLLVRLVRLLVGSIRHYRTQGAGLIGQSVVSIISDFMLSAAPVIILRNLQIEFTSKVGLCVLMGLGVM